MNQDFSVKKKQYLSEKKKQICAERLTWKKKIPAEAVSEKKKIRASWKSPRPPAWQIISWL